ARTRHHVLEREVAGYRLPASCYWLLATMVSAILRGVLAGGAHPGKVAAVSSAQEPLVLGIAALQRLFESSCDAFRQALGDSEIAADAVDFTGRLHDLSLAAGRVQALGEALTLLTGDQSWNVRANDTL